MDTLNAADLKSLLGQHSKWCVSLYMPTHRMGRDQQQNPIRLKNLLAEAETKLLANGLRRPEVQKLMGPAEQLLWDRTFWQHPADGLAIFLSDDFSLMYRLPAAFDERLVIGNSFHIKPLLPLLRRTGQFYILALSINNIRLFQANPDAIDEIPLDFPTNMEDALANDAPDKNLNLHGAMGTSGGRGGAGVFHGHGNTIDDKSDILQFFQSVSQGLDAQLADKTLPMILAGVDYLLPIFREASTYPNILEQSIIGNPERENLQELQEAAWAITRPLFEENQKRAVERFNQLHGQQSNLATTDLDTAVKAARFGQMEMLFVPLDAQAWGRYDAASNQVTRTSQPSAEDEDLLDQAAADTILNAGQVIALPREQMPGDGEVAAILRYALPDS